MCKSVICVCLPLGFLSDETVMSQYECARLSQFLTYFHFTLPSLSVPTWGSPHPLCPGFNLPSSPSPPTTPFPLCQWKIPPAQSQHSKAKPNTGCFGQSVWPALRGSTPNHFSTLMDQILNVLNDGLVIMEN